MKLPRWLRFKAEPDGKKIASMRHDGGVRSFPDLFTPGTKINYAEKIGDGLSSSVLMPPLNWVMRNFPMAPPVVEKFENGEWRRVPDHSILRLLQRPNRFYGGRELWMATALEFCFGNAYWLKVRDAAGRVTELWWVPSNTMRPRWPKDGSQYISHYEYRPTGSHWTAARFSEGMTVLERGSGERGSGSAIEVPVEDVVHLRFGLDPRNVRLGLSPLGALVREIYTDDEAANFASVILQNLGVIGVIIAPKEKGLASRDDVRETKEYLEQHFTGDKRGKTLALGQPTDVHLLQYNLQAFDLSPLRDVSEERVCAALGVPAAVVGFGTGLQTTKVGATMRELRRMAWTDGLIPLQDAIADQLTTQLLSDFDDADNLRLRFDYNVVPALMEDQAEKHARVRADYLAGIIKRSQAKQALGYPVEEGDEVYSQPTNMVLLQPGAAQGLSRDELPGVEDDADRAMSA